MSYVTIRTALLLAAAVTGVSAGAAAQRAPEQADMTIAPEVRAEVIDHALQALEAGYVFPEKAKAMEAAIRDHAQRHEYDDISSAKAFAERLTADLQAVSHDKHLRLLYSERTLPAESGAAPSPQERERQVAMARTFNFGFERVERLGGNIGYLDLRGFLPPDIAGDTAAAAMAFLANTDALIVDLRHNGGGEPAMVALLCSYFFDGEPVHLNDLYFRVGDTTQQYWTLPYVPGKRYVNKDLYILTSHYTFSGAEEFTYNLKNLKRATVVGETTGGGAHPGDVHKLTDHFGLFVPSGRAINPITKTNWEGVGVTPDIPVAADQALKTAQVDALKRLQQRATDPERKAFLEGAIQQAQRAPDAVSQR